MADRKDPMEGLTPIQAKAARAASELVAQTVAEGDGSLSCRAYVLSGETFDLDGRSWMWVPCPVDCVDRVMGCVDALAGLDGPVGGLPDVPYPRKKMGPCGPAQAGQFVA